MTNPELQERHAQAFHEGQQIDEIVGLHWHLGFSEDITGEDCPARDEATSELPLFACASAAASFQSAEILMLQFVRNASESQLHSRVAALDHSPQRCETLPLSILETLLSEVPLSTVTGVCLI